MDRILEMIGIGQNRKVQAADPTAGHCEADRWLPFADPQSSRPVDRTGRLRNAGQPGPAHHQAATGAAVPVDPININLDLLCGRYRHKQGDRLAYVDAYLRGIALDL